MRYILLKLVLFFCVCLSSASYADEFTVDFSSQKSYVDSLNSIRLAISTPLGNISQGGVSVSVINHVPGGNYISLNVRGLDPYSERFNHLRLIMERNNLYVAGFINTETNTFYRFSDFSHISVPDVITVSMTTDSSYSSLQRIADLERTGMQIGRHSLVGSYLDLMEFRGRSMTRASSRAMLRFVTVIAEALRFRQIQRGFRPALSEASPLYTMTAQDVDLTLNWGRISNVLPEYRGEEGVRIGRISFNSLSAILGSVAVILNCHSTGSYSVRSVSQKQKTECQIVGDRAAIKVNNVLWEANTIAALLNRKPQDLTEPNQ
ncbi:Shiga toxin Stx2 subunit A [Escherichia coli]|nr:Shiga toxin Stx2 subunit A [Escherichia coli]EFF4924194.1 Shiga toxin Stx2 subunit A [Escherichia coli]